MANWKISDRLRDNLCFSLDRMLDHRAAVVEQDFPLSPNEVYLATVPPRARQAFEMLGGIGADTVHTTRMLYAAVDPQALSGAERMALLEITLYREQRYVFNEQRWNPDHSWLSKRECIPFDPSVLTEETREKLTRWYNTALFERRICHAARMVAREFLKDHADSLGEIQQRWPGMRLLFDRIGEPWVSRMRDQSKSPMTRWKWPLTGASHDWWVENKARVQGADAVIAGAVGLPELSTASTVPVRAKIIKWEQKQDNYEN